MRSRKPYTRLKVLLKDIGMTYEEAAKLINMNKGSFASKINGKAVNDFTVEQLSKLIAALGFDGDMFLDVISDVWLR